MSYKENRNWLVLLVFIISVFSFLYIINIFFTFGLIFWEIAFIALIPNTIMIVWAVRRILGVKKFRIPKYRHRLVVFSLITLVIFNIFAMIPYFMVGPSGVQFENLFKVKLGSNYLNEIPADYRNRLQPSGMYLYPGRLLTYLNPTVTVQSNIVYGTDNPYQLFDKYEDTSIPGTNKPAIIFIHGGGAAGVNYKDTIYCVWTCKYFASLGFICFSIEYTLASVSPFPTGVKDVRTAIVHIKENAVTYNINASQIVLMGPSRGGHLSTLAAYTGVQNDSWWRANGGDFNKTQLEVACIVDLYGAVDPITSFQSSFLMTYINTKLFGVSYYSNPDIYNRHVVKNYVSSDCPPTLIVQGTIDGLVSAKESRDLAVTLDTVGAFNIYLEVPFGQHGFDEIPGTAGNLLTYYFVPRFILSVLFG